MSIDPEQPLFSVEHDHTQLDVLFEDLHAVALQTFAADIEPALLEDARAQWTFLREDIARHFSAEERKVFGTLEAAHPEMRPSLVSLMGQHDTLRRELTRMGQLLAGTPDEVRARKTEFETQWKGFEALWQDHSSTEWELLESVNARQPGPTTGNEEGAP